MDPSSFSSPELENPLQSSTERDATYPDYPFLGLPPLPDNSSVVFVLDKAPLEVAGYGNGCFIVDDDHKTFVRRSNKTLADYSSQALLAIKDSPIYRAGRVTGLYIRTEKGDILKLKPSSRVPRTYKQFASLMRDSLVPRDKDNDKRKCKVDRTKMKGIKNIHDKLTRCLPHDCHKIALSFHSEKQVKVQDYVDALPHNTCLVFMVGAMASGQLEMEGGTDCISISQFSLSSAVCVSKIAEALGNKWNIK